jgi:hypothetical protein
MRALVGRIALAVAVAALLGGAAHAAPVYRTPSFDELPDWSGVWESVGGTTLDQATADPKGAKSGTAWAREHPPYNDEWEKKYLANIAKVATGTMPDFNSYCGIPSGYPRILAMPETMEFLVRPEETWFVTENGPNVMRVYTDGRGHPPPDEIWDTYAGDSVGHWEGDTLVFDTIGVKGEGYQLIDRTGAITSNKLHGVVRMRMIEPGLIESKIVLEDPVAFTRPWEVTRRYKRLSAHEHIYEYACAENNRSKIGPDGFTLTLDAEGKVIDRRPQ